MWEADQIINPGMIEAEATIAIGAVPSDINDRGQVVGESNALPFVWSDGRMTALETLGGVYAAAGGINEAGDIVGFSKDAEREYRPTLWSPVDDGGSSASPVAGEQVAAGEACAPSDYANRRLVESWRYDTEGGAQVAVTAET